MKTCFLILLTGLCGSLLRAQNTQCPASGTGPCIVSITVQPGDGNAQLAIQTNSATPASPDITVKRGVSVQWKIQATGGVFYVMFLPDNPKILKKTLYYAPVGTSITDTVTGANITSEYLIFWKNGTQRAFLDPKVKSN